VRTTQENWLIIGFLGFFLQGCHATQQPVDEAGCSMPKGYVRILRQKTEPYDHWHVRIDKAGKLSWSGQSINLDELGVYSKQVYSVAGRLSLEIEDGAPCTKVEAVRAAIAGSKLCEQKRCVEDRWDVDVPIVN